MGWNEQDLKTTIADIMQDTMFDRYFDVRDTILHNEEGVDLIPSNLDLSAIEVCLLLEF